MTRIAGIVVFKAQPGLGEEAARRIAAALPALVAGAFAAAFGTLAVLPAHAQEFTEQQKKTQAENTVKVKSGKVEPCFGVALKGQNDCYAGAGRTRRERRSISSKTGFRRCSRAAECSFPASRNPAIP
nr:DUF2282 domain-containing protein [Rhizobium sp. ACO-34A]